MVQLTTNLQITKAGKCRSSRTSMFLVKELQMETVQRKVERRGLENSTENLYKAQYRGIRELWTLNINRVRNDEEQIHKRSYCESVTAYIKLQAHKNKIQIPIANPQKSAFCSKDPDWSVIITSSRHAITILKTNFSYWPIGRASN